MATYTTRNRLVKQATNENFNSWGDVLNAGGLEMIDEAMDGVTALALTGNVTLSNANGATDQARKRVLNITSADQARTITVPAVEKFYIVRNASAYAITLTVSGGGSTEVLPGQSADIFTNGTNIYRTNVSGWGLFATLPAGSGTSVTATLTSLNQHFTDCQIVIDGVSAPNTAALYAQLRNDSAAGDTAGVISADVTSSNRWWGSLEIPNYRRAVGRANAVTILQASSWGSPSQASMTTTTNIVWKFASGGIGSIVFSLSGAASFNNAGDFKVYLR